MALADVDVPTGDPAFFLVPPREQQRDEYAFLTPSTYELDFMTLTMEVGATLTFDDQTLDPQDYDPILIEGTTLQVVHIPIDDGPHRVSSNARLGLLVYAYDRYVSYAYPGGTNLGKIAP